MPQDDGSMRFDANGGRSKNYEPNSFDGPKQTPAANNPTFTSSGPTGRYELPKHRDDNDFVQAGALYRVMDEPARARLIGNIAGSLAQVSKNDIIERSIENFRKADQEYGRRLAEAVAARRKK